MLPRASSFAALASGAVSPFQPNQRPPVSLSASKTPPQVRRLLNALLGAAQRDLILQLIYYSIFLISYAFRTAALVGAAPLAVLIVLAAKARLASAAVRNACSKERNA